MQALAQLLTNRPDFDLDRLVEVANGLLPELVPDTSDARMKGEVNPRLVRHYTTQGLLEAPLRVGREARYTVDHLLQLLALRRLLADGVATSSIGTTLLDKDRDELVAIIQGRARVGLDVGTDARAAALGRIEAIRSRLAGAAPTAAPSPVPPPSSRPAGPSPGAPPGIAAARFSLPARDAATPDSWERFTLFDGVELHVRDDVRVPSSPDAQRRLLDDITRLLIQIAQRRMK